MAFGKAAVDWEERINYDRLRKERLEKARSQIEKDGLGAMLCFDYCNVRYTTGFYVPGVFRIPALRYVILPRNGDPTLFVEGAISVKVREEMTPWLKGRVKAALAPHWTYPDAGSEASLSQMIKTIGDTLAEYGVEKEPLGIDTASIPVLWFQKHFTKAGIDLVDGYPTMLEARKVKTKDEVELHRIAAANAEAAFASIRDAIRPGITELALAGVAIKTLFEQGTDEVQDLVVYFGENTNPITHQISDRSLRPGEMVIVDMAGQSYNGYKTCYYRSFTCGKATQRQKELYEECREMLYAGISKVKAGATTLDITNAWPSDPAYWGYKYYREVADLAMGHAIGLSLYETPKIFAPMAKANPVKLEENMVLALETWAGKKGGKEGARLEEDVVVTKDGYDLLTLWPVDEITEAWI